VRAVVQRVSRASVRVGEREVGSIGPGLCVLVGVGRADTPDDAVRLAEKVRTLRIFGDDEGAMNVSLDERTGGVLAVSQFTLYGDARRGRRPSFIDAAPGEQAQPLFDAFVSALRDAGVTVATGSFGAMMDLELVNDGPVTILLDTERNF
jgi:D-tyrosyl-tRNA(Tyr) deacylase